MEVGKVESVHGERPSSSTHKAIISAMTASLLALSIETVQAEGPKLAAQKGTEALVKKPDIAKFRELKHGDKIPLGKAIMLVIVDDEGKEKEMPMYFAKDGRKILFNARDKNDKQAQGASLKALKKKGPSITITDIEMLIEEEIGPNGEKKSISKFKITGQGMGMEGHSLTTEQEFGEAFISMRKNESISYPLFVSESTYTGWIVPDVPEDPPQAPVETEK